MKRFCCVVFDYNQIDLFFLNLHKLLNYNKETDIIVIVSCNSNKEYLQKLYARVSDFERKYTFEIILRNNWGIDQGAKIDFFLNYYKKYANYEAFLLMQEHFLDNTSDYAFYGKGVKNIEQILVEGSLKEDVLNPKFNLDLNRICVELKINLLDFPALNGCIEVDLDNKIFLLGDGGNLFVANKLIEKSEIVKKLPELILKYDRTYRWTLFVELEISNIFSKALHSDIKERFVRLSTTKLHSSFVHIYNDYKNLKVGVLKKIFFNNKLLIPIYSLFLKKLLKK